MRVTLPALLVVAAVAAAGALLLARGDDASSMPAPAAPAAATANVDPSLARELAALRAEVYRMKRDDEAPAAADAPDPDEAAAPPLTVDAAETTARLAAAMEAQADDPSWSRPTERSVGDVIATSAEGSRLREVRCGATLCRIEVEHASEEVQLGFLNRVLPYPPFDGPGAAQRVADPDHPDDLRTVIYLGRRDHELPI